MNVIAAEKESFPNTALKAVVLYDEPEFGARAVALLERVAIRVGGDMRWDVKSWGLDVVKKPSLIAVTLAVAVDADLILLALGEIQLPPPKLLAWLERWAARRHNADAAVTLLCPEEGAARPLQSGIGKFAWQHGLVFLGGRGAWNVEKSAPVVQVRLRRKQSGEPVVLPMPEPLPTPIHWGIND